MSEGGVFNQEALVQARIDIAALQKQTEAQGREIGELKAMIRDMAVKTATSLDAINATLSEARGGWKFMMVLGGAGATFGGFLVWVAQHLSVRGTP